MDRRMLLSVVAVLIIGISLPLGVYLYLRSQVMPMPSWLKSGAFVTYEQFFTWAGHNQTENMSWNIIRFEDDFADVHLVSHGVNVTGEKVEIVLGEANWTVNVFTREIVSSSDSVYVGKKFPFWVEKDVGIGSVVDTIYGVGTIQRNETISVLGQQRDCWIVEYNWPSSTMTRWYDKSSGVVLRIHVVLHQTVQIEITETVTATNINL